MNDFIEVDRGFLEYISECLILGETGELDDYERAMHTAAIDMILDEIENMLHDQ